VWHLREQARGRSTAIGAAEWGGILTGAAIIIISFAMDYRSIMAGGMPGRFPWEMFFAGLGAGVLSYARAARRQC